MIEEGLRIKFIGEDGNLSKSLGSLQSQLKRFETGLKEATNIDSFTRLQRAVDATKQKIQGLNGISTTFGKLSQGSDKASQALMNLSRVAQDAPYGFIGIANNINPLLESFQRLQKESGSTGSALKAMVAGISGPAGLGLGIGVVSSLVVAFGDKLFGASQQVEKLKSAFDSLTTADAMSKVGGEFNTAFEAVSQLRNEVDLAKNGFIAKDDVVKHYNTTLGETIGKVSTLDQVERSLAKNADAYIKFTLLKAAANVALSEAAKKAVDVAQIQATDFKLPAISPTEDPAAREAKEKQKQLVNILKQGTIAKVNEVKDGLLKIATNFNTEAAKIAKEFKFDYFGGDFDKATTPKKINTKKIEKDFSDALKNTKIPVDVTLVPKIDDGEDWQKMFLSTIENIRKKLNDEGGVPIDILPTPKEIDIIESKEKLKKAYEKAGIKIPLDFDTTSLDILKAKFKELTDNQAALVNLTSGFLTPAFQGFFDAALHGGNAMESFIDNLKSSVDQLVAKLVAAAIQAAAISLITGGGTSFIDAFLGGFGYKIPGHAKGGVVPPGHPNDSYLARLTSGERILTVAQTKQFDSIIKGLGQTNNFPAFALPNFTAPDFGSFPTASSIVSGLKTPKVNMQSNVSVNVTGSLRGDDLVLQHNRVTRSQRRTS